MSLWGYGTNAQRKRSLTPFKAHSKYHVNLQYPHFIKWIFQDEVLNADYVCNVDGIALTVQSCPALTGKIF